MPDTCELIATWREAERKATPGPWNAQGEGICCGLYSEPDHILIFNPDSTWADAQFIELSRNAARPLLDLLDQCRELLSLWPVCACCVGGTCDCECHKATNLLAQLPAKE